MGDDKDIRFPSYEGLDDEKKAEVDRLVEEYLDYLDEARTVHTTVNKTIELAEKEGYIKYREGMTLDDIGDSPGVYFVDRNHLNVAIVRFGEKDITHGLNIAGAHVDFCSLLNKRHSLIEKEDGVYLDTKPYGGFYSHQWMDKQLKVIGETVLDIKNEEGKIVGHKILKWEISGTIPEATIHNPGGPRSKDNYNDMFPMEDLDVFTGYTSKEAFLKEISRQASEQVGETVEITEELFNSGKTEFTVVPANQPKIIGDYIVGYGHDDRSCMFAATKAILNSKDSIYTSIVLGVAREEIGSTAKGGAKDKFFDNVVKAVAEMQGIDNVDLDKIYRKSIMYSADVDIAYNPQNSSVNDKENCSKFGYGAAIVISNGRNGNPTGNYITARDLVYFTDALDNRGIPYQVNSLPSKVGIGGGGGTIAKYYSEKGILTADLGVPVGNMHGLNSRIYKGDLYAVEKAFESLIERDFELSYFG